MKTITQNQYYQLLGLISLAQEHYQKLDDIAAAVDAIVAPVGTAPSTPFEGETNTKDYSDEAVWENNPKIGDRVHFLLKRLEINVEVGDVCRVCGCTDDNACEGGCYWVEENLCSACADKAAIPSAREDELEAALRELNQVLTVPAAEYVPAISDAFRIIDGALNKTQGERKI